MGIELDYFDKTEIDQQLTRDPAHSQLLIVTRHIWHTIIQNNLLPWRKLTLMARDALMSSFVVGGSFDSLTT